MHTAFRKDLEKESPQESPYTRTPSKLLLEVSKMLHVYNTSCKQPWQEMLLNPTDSYFC